MHASAVPVHAPAHLREDAACRWSGGEGNRRPDEERRATHRAAGDAGGIDVTVPDPEPALATVADGAVVTVNGNDTEDESFPSIPRIKRLYGPVPAVNATRMLSVLDAELLASAGELSVTVTLSGTATTDSDTVPLALPTIDNVAVAV